MPDFVQNGRILPDGQRVIDYINAQIIEAESKNDVNALNGLSGMVKHYLANVRLAKTITEAQWLSDYNYAAGSIHQLLEDQAAAKAEKDALKEADAGLAAELEKVKQLLEGVIADNTALRTELDALKKPAKKNSKKDAETEDTES